jgi:large subunit ribosomal protein L13
MTKTFIPKQSDIEQKCYLIDATDKILGRVATKVAAVVRGKHKPIFTPHLDTGDMVIVINADKIKVTGKKLDQKEYNRYSGYPGGRKTVRLGDMLKNRPAQVLRLAVNRMIQKGPLGNKLRTRFRIYAGDKHTHQAQKPIPLEI